MIVKIRCDGKWLIYDNFTKIGYEFIKNDEPHPDVDAKWFGQKGIGCSDILIIGKRWDDTEFSIISNQDVYLLNDEGRTIEKLN